MKQNQRRVTPKQILRVVDTVLSDHFGDTTLNDKMRFSDDLGVDSLDALEITFALEEAFEEPFPDESDLKFSKWTIGDLKSYVVKYIQSKF